MTKIIKDKSASIRARLLMHAKQSGEEYQRTLTRFAIERLLFRLSQSGVRDRYVLKGAMLFVTWPENVFRPTGDLDLLGHGDPDPAAIVETFQQICAVEADDGLHFDLASIKVDPVREADKYQGARVMLNGELAKAIIRVQVDIGFGDHVYPAPKLASFPSILPDLPTASILMYPPETVVAEKFEAMIRFGLANGRIKDFYDIWLTTQIFQFQLSTVIDAVAGTLARRGTAVPTARPEGFSQAYATIAAEKGLWSGFLERNPPMLAPPAFPELQRQLTRFFEPVIAGLNAPGGAESRWDPVEYSWR
ncbi:nucleotidyl transferase AbiEii/AbiGii toxin family protein (plasmid) [Rhizobium sp. CB3171]|uniref:nucleotidyl transferase AbiEii/AbiGii toxin family protein n=1 Tax=Rhizobium sp. CB3171 TaxID=3039157 RepID=UPI0024B137F4|nr:nucleotidyl transferase AbiEii/AbiGii toxin family protein [Rhizobium sp. CB3171]WFU07374.1 nucleotidyl transferase AbiEii/AbiGii toxin family protein [Rhizobium sp. CB3171]